VDKSRQRSSWGEGGEGEGEGGVDEKNSEWARGGREEELATNFAPTRVTTITERHFVNRAFPEREAAAGRASK